MYALVVGGNGFIGSHLVDRLLIEGHRVRVYDKYEEYYRSPLIGVDYRIADFGNRGLLKSSLEGIDIVYHLINTTIPETSNNDPVFDVISNVGNTLYLLEQCVSHKVQKVVFISSGGTIYGAQEILPVQEEVVSHPLCSYGICKLTIEKYLALFRHLYNLDYVVLRPSNPYGNRQNPNGIQGVISVFLGKIARGKTVEVWGDGKVIRDYIFIDDLIDPIYRSAITMTKSTTFNVGSGLGLSLNELIAIISKVIDTKFIIKYMPGRKLDIPKIWLDISRAKSELQWSPVISIEEGIRRTWKFIISLENRKIS